MALVKFIKKTQAEITATPIIDGQMLVSTDTTPIEISVDINGTTRRKIPTTSDEIGASPINHESSDGTYGKGSSTKYGHVKATETLPLIAGTATLGTDNGEYARGDHAHPEQIDVSGNSGTTTKLATARTVSLSGGAVGVSSDWDGSSNLTIPVTSIDGTKITGTIPLSSIPQAALERLAVVADDTARFALTTSSVQNGDVVKVVSSNLMYFIKDDSQLNNENGYEPFTAGVASSVPWAGVSNPPTTLSGYGITDAVPISGGTMTGDLVAPNVTSVLHGTSEGVVFVESTHSGRLDFFEGNAPTIENLYDGLQIMYNFTSMPSSETSQIFLNLTLKDNISTGNVPCYYRDAIPLMRKYLVNYGFITLIYKSQNGNVGVPAWYMQTSYAPELDQLKFDGFSIKSPEPIYRYKLFSQDINGIWYPFFTKNKTNISVVLGWTVSTREFLIGAPMLINNNPYTIEATYGFSGAYFATDFDVRYNIDVSSLPSSSGSLYLKGTLGPNGGFLIKNGDYYAVNLPTVDDGFYYMYVGFLLNDSSCRLVTEHPVYYFKNEKINIYSAETSNMTWAEITNTPSTLDGYGIIDAVPVSGTTMTGDLISNNPALGTFAVRNISAGTTDMIAGTTPLATGAIYLYYEE